MIDHLDCRVSSCSESVISASYRLKQPVPASICLAMNFLTSLNPRRFCSGYLPRPAFPDAFNGSSAKGEVSLLANLISRSSDSIQPEGSHGYPASRGACSGSGRNSTLRRRTASASSRSLSWPAGRSPSPPQGQIRVQIGARESYFFC